MRQTLSQKQFVEVYEDPSLQFMKDVQLAKKVEEEEAKRSIKKISSALSLATYKASKPSHH